MITMIAATSVNGVIGLRGQHKLLWKSKLDLDIFYKNTKGTTVVMGMNTFKSLDGPLKDRFNIVLSRKEKPGIGNGVTYYNNIGDIITNYSDFTVIGGEAIYNLFLPVADEVLITTLSLEFEGEEEEDYAYFPLDKMEEEFFMASQSEVMHDQDEYSGVPLNLIFSRWQRGIPNIH